MMDGFLGRVVLGFEFTSFGPGPNFDGLMQFDNLRIEHLSIPEPAPLGLMVPALLGLWFAQLHRHRGRFAT